MIPKYCFIIGIVLLNSNYMTYACNSIFGSPTITSTIAKSPKISECQYLSNSPSISSLDSNQTALNKMLCTLKAFLQSVQKSLPCGKSRVLPQPRNHPALTNTYTIIIFTNAILQELGWMPSFTAFQFLPRGKKKLFKSLLFIFIYRKVHYRKSLHLKIPSMVFGTRVHMLNEGVITITAVHNPSFNNATFTERTSLNLAHVVQKVLIGFLHNLLDHKTKVLS